MIDFRVEMIDPLTPDDELRYRGLLAQDQKPESSGSYDEQKPDSSDRLPGQRTEFSPSLADQRSGFSVRPDQKPQAAGSPDGQETKFAGIGQPTGGTEPEAGVGRRKDGREGNAEAQVVGSRCQRPTGEDLFAGIRPVPVGVEVDPGVQVSGSRGGDRDLGGSADIHR